MVCRWRGANLLLGLCCRLGWCLGPVWVPGIGVLVANLLLCHRGRLGRCVVLVVVFGFVFGLFLVSCWRCLV